MEGGRLTLSLVVVRLQRKMKYKDIIMEYNRMANVTPRVYKRHTWRGGGGGGGGGGEESSEQGINSC